MKFEGGCYCKQVRYEAEGEPMIKAECFCRECQYITGGGGLVVMAMPTEGVEVTQGAVKDFKRDDIEGAVTRQFCPNCGTHLFTRRRGLRPQSSSRSGQWMILRCSEKQTPSISLAMRSPFTG
jgi:hypothetical protein